MMILISPSFGSSETRRHWADTIDKLVDFTVSPQREALTEAQFGELLQLHPSGLARFWGATEHHDQRFAEVATGDVVLFTGQKQVRAIGEVGAVFQSAEFADLLWPPENGRSWHNVYSVLDVVPTEIHYQELNAVLGYQSSFAYPGQMFIGEERAKAVLDNFLITPSTEATWHASARAGSPSRSDLVLSPAHEVRSEEEEREVRRAAAEENRTYGSDYQRTQRLIVVERREAELVRDYRDHLASRGVNAERYYCPAGITDLYTEGPGGAEVIEAKSAVSHHHVRQALGQLLDYAPYSPEPAQRLVGLFPTIPGATEMALLHRYGIDCVFRTSPGDFSRRDAPEQRRVLMSQAWTGRRR